MKMLKYCTMAIFAILFLVNLACTTKAAASDFIELSFTIDNKYYSSKGIQKQLEVAPFIENESTMVPFRIILEELGYHIEWSDKDSTIIATSENSTIKLQINNKLAVVNDEEKEMTVAPKIVSGKTVVPLRFISENSNSNVSWDGATKTIYISRAGVYDTGKIMIFEKKAGNKNIAHLYDGKQIKSLILDNSDIVNWYSYKGKILATIFDGIKNQNHFAIYNGQKFNTLIEDFDIKDTFEYNNNLIIHGYDRSQKVNMLYRFDGQKLILLQNNFYVGKYILFKDKLVINKYDNTRNYSLLAFDKNSWTPGILANGFVIKGNIEHENILYLAGTWQQGAESPLIAYDGNSIGSSSLSILNSNINLNINETVVYNKKLYAVYKGELITIEKTGVTKILVPYDSSTFIKYNANTIKTYNNRLFVGILGGQFVDSNGKSKPTPKLGNTVVQILPCVLEFEDTSKIKTLAYNFAPSEFRVENDVFLFTGTDKATKDLIMYVYDGRNMYKALDVIKIKQTIKLNNKLFIDVNDKDRITGKLRDTVILFDGQRFINLVIGMQMKNWSTVGESLVLSGYEPDIKVNKLYSYTTKFSELINSFNIKYWNQSANILFVNGYNPSDKSNILYKFTNNKLVKVNENIEVINMIKIKGRYYLVYGYNKDSQSPLNSKKILYLFNDADGKFTEMKINIELTKMIFVE